MLDGFQAGLAWITILKKREAFRAAFANFDPEMVARYGERRPRRLMADAGIVRSNAKIDAAIARRADLPRDAGARRGFLRLPVELRRRQADPEPTGPAIGAGAGADARGRGDGQGA